MLRRAHTNSLCFVHQAHSLFPSLFFFFGFKGIFSSPTISFLCVLDVSPGFSKTWAPALAQGHSTPKPSFCLSHSPFTLSPDHSLRWFPEFPRSASVNLGERGSTQLSDMFMEYDGLKICQSLYTEMKT